MVVFGQSCLTPCENLGPHLQNLRKTFSGPITPQTDLYKREEEDRIAPVSATISREQEVLAEEFKSLEVQGRQALITRNNLKDRTSDGDEFRRQSRIAEARLHAVVDDIVLLLENARASYGQSQGDEGTTPMTNQPATGFLAWLVDGAKRFFVDVSESEVSICQNQDSSTPAPSKPLAPMSQDLTAPSISRVTTGPPEEKSVQAATPTSPSMTDVTSKITAGAQAACGKFSSKSFEDKRPTLKQHKENVQSLLKYIYTHVPVLTSIHLEVGIFNENLKAGAIVCVEEVILYRDNSMRKFSKDNSAGAGKNKRHPACVVYQETRNIENSFIVSNGLSDVRVTNDANTAFYAFLVSNYLVVYRATDHQIAFDRASSVIYLDARVQNDLRSYLPANLGSSFIEFAEDDNCRYSLSFSPRKKSGVEEDTTTLCEKGPSSLPVTLISHATWRDRRFAYYSGRSPCSPVFNASDNESEGLATCDLAGQSEHKSGQIGQVSDKKLKKAISQVEFDEKDSSKLADCTAEELIKFASEFRDSLREPNRAFEKSDIMAATARGRDIAIRALSFLGKEKFSESDKAVFKDLLYILDTLCDTQGNLCSQPLQKIPPDFHLDETYASAFVQNALRFPFTHKWLVFVHIVHKSDLKVLSRAVSQIDRDEWNEASEDRLNTLTTFINHLEPHTIRRKR